MRNRRFRFGRSIVTLQPPRTVREVRDPAAARALAYSVHEQLGRAYVEALLQDFTGPFFDERRDDATLCELLARQITGGKFLVVEHEQAPRTLDAPKSTRLIDLIVDGPGGEQPRPARPAVPAVTTSFDVTLVTEAGTPLAGVELAITLTNGKVRTHPTDGNGRVFIDGLSRAGDCTVAATTLVRLPPVRDEPPVDAPAHGIQMQRTPADPIRLVTGIAHTIVVVRPRVRVLALARGYFGEDRKLLLFGLEGAAAPGEFEERVTARAVFRTLFQIAAGAQILVAGHTDTVGGDDDNQTLSEQRATNVDLYLRGERDAWADHCHARQKEADVRAILTWVAMVEGADCTPSQTLGPALERFRARFVASGTTQSTASTTMSIADWLAVYDLYERDLARLLVVPPEKLAELRARLEFLPHAPLGCGERHPAEAVGMDGFECDDNRRVDILLFDPAQLPDLATDPLDDDIYGGTFAPTTIHVPGESLARIEVVDGAGAPAPYAEVRIRTNTGEIVAVVDAAGAATIPCLVGDAIEVLDAHSANGDQRLLWAQASRRENA